VTECQGCGAWNDASRMVCVLCGTPLAETDEWEATAELPPLPPLPDGGLSASMPAWLRELPAEVGGRRTEDRGPSRSLPSSVLRPPSPVPLGPRADPRTFLSDDDFPRWLRDLAAREARSPVPTVSSVGARPAAPWPGWPGLPASAAPDPGPPATPDSRELATVGAARALEERRSRAPWETLLLVILFLGVIVAALWALVSNGVFSPSL
jgi:hypothetical protein